MATVRITKTATVPVSVNQQTVRDLKQILEQIPDGARFQVDHCPGDQRDSSYTNLIFSWTD